MVMSFFHKGPSGLEHVLTRTVTMLGDARHSFDLATTAALSGSAPSGVIEDILSTDQRINQAEQDLRSELVVHVSVQGAADIGTVLGYILLLKKVERIGDQAKNILDLAEEGISLAERADIEVLSTERQEVSALFGVAGELLTDTEPAASAQFVSRVSELMAEYQAKIDGYMASERPGKEVVPLAIYYRYLKRIVANLRGVVGVAIDPLPQIDYLDDGATDTDD